jgi:hypothetical protein
MRAIGMMMVDSRLKKGDSVEIEIRGSRVQAMIVPYHLRSDAPPRAMPILRYDQEAHRKPVSDAWREKARTWWKRPCGTRSGARPSAST